MVVFGAWMVIAIPYNYYRSLDYGFELTELSWKDVSWFGIVKKLQFSFQVGLLFIASGILILFKNKVAWIATIASLIVFGLTATDGLVNRDVTTTVMYEDNTELLILGGIWAIVIISFLLLTTNPVRRLFKVNKRSWLYIGVILMYFMLNKLLF